MSAHSWDDDGEEFLYRRASGYARCRLDDAKSRAILAAYDRSVGRLAGQTRLSLHDRGDLHESHVAGQRQDASTATAKKSLEKVWTSLEKTNSASCLCDRTIRPGCPNACPSHSHQQLSDPCVCTALVGNI